MQELRRNDEYLTPISNEDGSNVELRKSVEINKKENIEENEKTKSRFRVSILFIILDILLLAAVVYQVVKIFIELFSNL